MTRSLFCLVVGALLVSGCGPEAPKQAPTAKVKGNVKLDGKPMESGEVTFSVPGEPVRTLAVSGGSYSGEAVVGQNKVEVASYKEGPPLSTDPTGKPTKTNIVAGKFNFQSTLSANVAASGENNFDFDVTSQ
jgi:hypothetical protein